MFILNIIFDSVPRDRSSTRSSVSPVRNMLYKSVPHVTMNWQPLVKSDCHVLKSVEESLHNPPQPSVLMHSCEFFCNVMLQDFPAEVFLQRPSILSVSTYILEIFFIIEILILMYHYYIFIFGSINYME